MRKGARKLPCVFSRYIVCNLLVIVRKLRALYGLFEGASNHLEKNSNSQFRLITTFVGPIFIKIHGSYLRFPLAVLVTKLLVFMGNRSIYVFAIKCTGQLNRHQQYHLL